MEPILEDGKRKPHGRAPGSSLPTFRFKAISRPAACVGIALVLFLPAAGSAAGARILFPEERITSDTRNYEMTKNPTHSMVVDDDGTVHLVFWDGEIGAIPTEEEPNRVWYCRREPDGTWSDPITVDDSYSSVGKVIGGRHPSIVLAPDGTVYVFWHDYRHCSGLPTNVEIYMDACPPDGSFSATDIRLTSAPASHAWSNAYLPKAVVASNGEISLVWYDYYFNPTRSDIFFLRSDDHGHFDLQTPMEDRRVTTASLVNNGLTYAVPDLTLDKEGNVHLVWTRAWEAGFGVHYGRLDGDGRLTTSTLLIPGASSYYYPPHITATPTGDIYILWFGYSAIPEARDLFASRLPRGATSFHPPLSIASGSLGHQAHVQVDQSGLLHVANTPNGYDVEYSIYDTETQTTIWRHQVSEASTRVAGPCIALDRRGQAYIAWTDYRHGSGQIYFRKIAPATNTRPDWRLYL